MYLKKKDFNNEKNNNVESDTIKYIKAMFFFCISLWFYLFSEKNDKYWYNTMKIVHEVKLNSNRP